MRPVIEANIGDEPGVAIGGLQECVDGSTSKIDPLRDLTDLGKGTTEASGEATTWLFWWKEGTFRETRDKVGGLMPPFFQDFGFVEWWKAIAVGLTGIFAFLALAQENKDKKTGNLTKWGMISIFGIVISAAGGLVAQIIDSSNQPIAEKKRHSEVMSILTDQARLLTPLRVDKVFGEFKVPCEAAYLSFCNAVRAFRKGNPESIMPINLFDAFPGGPSTIILLSLRFFTNEDEAKAQLTVYDDQKSKYSVYMQLPLRAGDDIRCGMRVGVFLPDDEVWLFIHESCPFFVNNFGGLQSHLDLNGLEFSTNIAPNVPGVPSLEPVRILMVYADAQRDTMTNLSRVQANNGTIYIAKFVKSAVPSRPRGAL